MIFYFIEPVQQCLNYTLNIVLSNILLKKLRNKLLSLCSLPQCGNHFSTQRAKSDKLSPRDFFSRPARYFQSINALGWVMQCFSGSGTRR